MVLLTYSRLHTDNAVAAERMNNIADQYFAPHTVLAAAGVFALFKSFDNGREIQVLDRLAAEIDKCSFGIYPAVRILYSEFLEYCADNERVRKVLRGNPAAVPDTERLAQLFILRHIKGSISIVLDEKSFSRLSFLYFYYFLFCHKSC